jgi:hypothetical protein
MQVHTHAPRAHVRAHMHAHVRARAHTHTHTHTHTRARARAQADALGLIMSDTKVESSSSPCPSCLVEPAAKTCPRKCARARVRTMVPRVRGAAEGGDSVRAATATTGSHAARLRLPQGLTCSSLRVGEISSMSIDLNGTPLMRNPSLYLFPTMSTHRDLNPLLLGSYRIDE